MSKAPRVMALTADLVDWVARPIEDAGPTPGMVYMTDEDYAAAVKNVLAQAPNKDVWLFAYGSLLWKPACEHVEARMAAVLGWHRAFCFRVARFRGTREKPGLMLALDRGGKCKGMIFRLPADQVEASLETLFRREVMVIPPVNVSRWMTAETREGHLRVLGFVVNRDSPHYAGKLSEDEAADILATAAGHWGSCAEYLRETVFRLEELGIHDRSLWRIQERVADRIKLTNEYPDGQ
jgi:glutathione-specific gamma-glutamylcyclotransferase